MAKQICYGKVLKFNENFIRGTIVGDDKQQYFVDETCILDRRKVLYNDERVSFTVEADQWGRLYADNVKRLKPVDAGDKKKSKKKPVKKQNKPVTPAKPVAKPVARPVARPVVKTPVKKNELNTKEDTSNNNNSNEKDEKNNNHETKPKNTPKKSKKKNNLPVFYGKIAEYSKNDECGLIRMNNKDHRINLYFNKNNCMSYVNLMTGLNVSFSIRKNKNNNDVINDEYAKLNEAYNIRMTRQDELIGFVTLINIDKQFGYISPENKGKYTKDIYFDGKKKCKDFNKLVTGDAVKYVPFYTRNGMRINNVKYIPYYNIINKKSVGKVTGLNINEDRGITILYIRTQVADEDIRCLVPKTDLKIKKLDQIYIDIFRNKINGKLYGKNIVRCSNTYGIPMSTAEKKKLRKRLNKNNNKSNKNVKNIIVISENSQSPSDIIIPVKKNGISLDDIMNNDLKKYGLNNKRKNKSRKIRAIKGGLNSKNINNIRSKVNGINNDVSSDNSEIFGNDNVSDDVSDDIINNTQITQYNN